MREPKSTARDIVLKSKSPFVDDETLESWIGGAIEEAAEEAKRAESDRIEKFIGTRSWQQMKACYEIAKFKHANALTKGKP